MENCPTAKIPRRKTKMVYKKGGVVIGRGIKKHIMNKLELNVIHNEGVFQGNSVKKMKVLLACEESQAVCIEFRKLGHEAYSCDILPCTGGHPEWHIQKDITQVLGKSFQAFGQFWTEAETVEPPIDKWDLIIAFPPCTYLTVTGNRWFNIERYGEKAIKRHEDRLDAISFFMMFAKADCDKIVIENPVGVMSSQWRKPNQIINPYQFGDPFEKKTCLWLKGLPKLKPTNIVKPPRRTEFKSGKLCRLGMRMRGGCQKKNAQK